MNLAVALALAAAVWNLGTAVLHFALSRAPGWRGLRAFAVIALTAGAYDAINVGYPVAGFGDDFYIGLDRALYLVASLHTAAWLVYAFGRDAQRWRDLPKKVQVAALGLTTAGVLLALTGLHVTDQVETFEVPWAGVRYRYPLTSTIGDVYSVVLFIAVAITGAEFARRARRREPGATIQLVGFVIFLLTMANELVTAVGRLPLLSLSDIGFVSIVAPLSVQLIRRFLADAHRLEQLTATLRAEVSARTDELARAQAELADKERLASLGRLAAGIGHEIANPLTFCTLALETINEHVRAHEVPPQVGEALGELAQGTERIRAVVEQLRAYSAPGSSTTEVTVRSVVVARLGVPTEDLEKEATPAPHLAREDVPTPRPIVVTSETVVVEPPPLPTPVRGRVLIIDDEPAIGRSIARWLRRAAWQVTIAESGAQALELVRQDPDFAVVLCDLMMPEMSGMELADRLAVESPALRARTLFLTGGAVSQDAMRFLARPDVTHLEKPLDLDELVRRLDALG